MYVISPKTKDEGGFFKGHDALGRPASEWSLMQRLTMCGTTAIRSGARKQNAYTDRPRMVVAETGAANAGKWVVARHDVLQDVIAEFGSEQAHMIQLSIASDTDDTGERAHAGFADFHFVDRNTPCFTNSLDRERTAKAEHQQRFKVFKSSPVRAG